MTNATGSTPRPAVPTALKRQLYEEAGYRCAVPTCKGTSALEMAHIEPWSVVQAHSFENMIVLCAVDHTRFDRGEIPIQSIRVYKSNLGVINSRYGEFERRMLEYFGTSGADYIDIPNGRPLDLFYLLRDGHLVEERSRGGVFMGNAPIAQNVRYQLTASGQQLVRDFMSATTIL
jgi:hypothetical protein